MKKNFNPILEKQILIDPLAIVELQELDLLDLPPKLFNETYISEKSLSKELNKNEILYLYELGYKSINIDTSTGFEQLYFFERNYKNLSHSDKLILSIVIENNITLCTSDKYVETIYPIVIDSINLIDMICLAFENELILKKQFINLFNNYCTNICIINNLSILSKVRNKYNIPVNNIMQLNSYTNLELD